MRRSLRPDYRRAVILMVVLAMLALFAIVGLSFVLFAQNNNTRSNNFSLAWQKGFTGSASQGNSNGGNNGNNGNNGNAGGNAGGTPFTPPAATTMFRWAVGQLIYDQSDTAGGSLSAIRGHSLARTMYGYNDAALNTQPFNGTGRYHYAQPALNNLDDYYLVNYTYFPGVPLRDPERVGTRNDPTAPRGIFTGGANSPTTYPNLDNMFLAASSADGKLISPSFHRQWLWGAPINDRTNARWTDLQGRLSSLRPRPADNLQQYPDGRNGFPYPSDAGGDVKNKIGYPGGNDSIWMDLGYPVQVAGDGRRYKPLFAFLVEDLDNRVNLNTAGNLMGRLADGTPGHTSNQGWGKWEASLAKVINNPAAPNEWRNLLTGNPAAPTIRGRYGPDGVPSKTNNSSTGSKKTRYFGQADWNGSNETAGNAPTGTITLPPFPPPAMTSPGMMSAFPTFPAGFGNGATSEHLHHASLYDYFRPYGPPGALWDDSRFGTGATASDMKKLLINGHIGLDALSTDITQLCPTNFDLSPQGLRRRNLITLLSMQLGRNGMSPWLYRRSGGYTMPNTSADFPPVGPAVAAELVDGGGNPRLRRENDSALEAINLDRVMRSYPHQSNSVALPNGYHGRFDYDPAANATNAAIVTAFTNAQTDRQNMAKDVFLRLLILTGVPGPANAAAPTDDELKPIRWMAQLAANIVDFIDEDEICTPFNFYYPTAYNFYTNVAPTAQQLTDFVGASFTNNGANNEKVPRYWVFGTELPSVVLNEVFTHYELPLDATTMMPTSGMYPLKVWAELYTPFPPSVPSSTQAQDANAWPLYIASAGAGQPAYSTYKIELANTTTAAEGYLLARQDNVLGAADQVRATTKFDQSATVKNVGGTDVPTAVSPQSSQGSGYFIVGPTGNTRGNTIASPRVPTSVPWFRNDSMQYQVNYNLMAGTHTPNDRYDATAKSGGVTVLLRRLANPHIPEQGDPGLPNYNPYITFDYMEQVPPVDVTVLPNQNAPVDAVARGKKQPYASDLTTQVVDQVYAADTNKHTLGTTNDPSDNRVWLTHLDRQLISPYELLTVSGYRPHQLTHRFITGGKAQQHLVNWMDDGLAAGQSHRLFRLFGMLETPDRAAGISLRGRSPGKVNINTIWDFETFSAICDRNASNTFTDADVVNAWRALMASRSPGAALDPANPMLNPNAIPALSATDRPFYDMAVPIIPGNDPSVLGGRGLEDTIFRYKDPNAAVKERLFQTTQTHPYMQNELINKIANNITTRSNVFAVWLTVGFFEVVANPTPGGPDLLGEEIDVRTTPVRYRFFSIVDRTQLVIAPVLTETAGPAGGLQYYPIGTPTTVRVIPKSDPADQFYGLSGFITYEGNPAVQVPWEIKAGTVIVVDRGTDVEETVVVESVNNNPFAPTFTTTFRREHRLMTITMHGNPGPKPNWDPNDPTGSEQFVVPYWEVLP